MVVIDLVIKHPNPHGTVAKFPRSVNPRGIASLRVALYKPVDRFMEPINSFLWGVLIRPN
ncbi:hypothetical protein GCM10007874_43050 [Labrys miyagiensis]|uniref:Uncharacterized protein n=1 Tax=Labrys miyagiensis TaxID=346912 RepID=A0ABQ6CLT9_9HYPH|nr:hypothetical protein GCM10007874_43050 [Labrys miyagiensis]